MKAPYLRGLPGVAAFFFPGDPSRVILARRSRRYPQTRHGVCRADVCGLGAGGAAFVRVNLRRWWFFQNHHLLWLRSAALNRILFGKNKIRFKALARAVREG